MTTRRSRRAFLATVGAVAGCTGVGSAETPTTDVRETTTADTTETSAASAPPDPTDDHPTVGVDPARTGFNPDERGPTGPVKAWWCVGAGGGNRLTPLAVAGGTVFSGSPSRGLRALDAATGEVRWRATFDGYPSAPTVAGDRVVVAADRAIYGLGRASGRELWSFAPGEHVTTSALVTDAGGSQTVFAATRAETESGEWTGARVHALDAADGEPRWDARVDGRLYGSLAARDGAVYGGGGVGRLYAFDAATGEIRWRAELGDHADSPAAGPDAVFVGDEPGTVHALDPEDGATRWTYETGAEVRTAPAVADGTVYVAASDGVLHAIDARTGDRRWRFDGGRRLTRSPTVVGGGGGGSDEDSGRGGARTVYVGSGQGNVFAVDATTGERRWSYQLPDAVESPPTVVDGVAFVGDGEGRLHALVDESAATSAATERCRSAQTESPARSDATRDADGDGVPDAADYAPRDGSVSRRSDLEAERERDPSDFGVGVGVGAAASVLGVAAGWVLRGRRGAGDP